MAIQVLYGANEKYIDVTEMVKKYCIKNSHIEITDSDIARSNIFSDPNYGVVKNIIIIDNNIKTIYPDDVKISYHVPFIDSIYESPENKLNKLHNLLKFTGGSLNDEYPEQLLSASFIPADAKVLEIGANIGRNTCTIASLLDDSSNLVALECDLTSSSILKNNRDMNNFKFKIEESALSKRKLIQNGWNTIPSDELLPGWTSINTINWEQLNNKYKINFDTLVVDCEGALYWILKDEQELLTNFKLLLLENDYADLSHKQYVDSQFIKHGFKCIRSLSGGWGPCYENFYEVWSK